MGSRFLLWGLLVIVLSLGLTAPVQAKDFDVTFDGACVGGVINSSQLFDTSPSIPNGLRDKGRWVTTGGLDFSNKSYTAVIGGFTGAGPYNVEFRLHNGDRYFYTITAPVTASSFSLESGGSTAPVLLDESADYPVALNVDPTTGATSYAYYYRNVETGTVSTHATASASPNWSFYPADDQPIYSAYAVVTHDVDEQTCRSLTNAIEISENLTLQVVGGGSVCQTTGTITLEVLPYDPNYYYEWSLPGKKTSTGQDYEIGRAS